MTHTYTHMPRLLWTSDQTDT